LYPGSIPRLRATADWWLSSQTHPEAKTCIIAEAGHQGSGLGITSSPQTSCSHCVLISCTDLCGYICFLDILAKNPSRRSSECDRPTYGCCCVDFVVLEFDGRFEGFRWGKRSISQDQTVSESVDKFSLEAHLIVAVLMAQRNNTELILF
jgi:hypothetical protein